MLATGACLAVAAAWAADDDPPGIACEAVGRIVPGLASGVAHVDRRVRELAAAAAARCGGADEVERCLEWQTTADAAALALDHRVLPAIRDLAAVHAARCAPPSPGAESAVREALTPISTALRDVNVLQTRLLAMRRDDCGQRADGCEALTAAAYALNEDFKRQLTGPWLDLQMALPRPTAVTAPAPPATPRSTEHGPPLRDLEVTTVLAVAAIILSGGFARRLRRARDDDGPSHRAAERRGTAAVSVVGGIVVMMAAVRLVLRGLDVDVLVLLSFGAVSLLLGTIRRRADAARERLLWTGRVAEGEVVGTVEGSQGRRGIAYDFEVGDGVRRRGFVENLAGEQVDRLLQAGRVPVVYHPTNPELHVADVFAERSGGGGTSAGTGGMR